MSLHPSHLSCYCPRLENFALHSDDKPFQCLQPFFRGHVFHTAVSSTERSTTDHVVRSTYKSRPRRAFHHRPPRAIHPVARSHPLHYHVDVDRCDDTISSIEMTKSDLIQRTTCARTVSVLYSHACCQVHSSTSPLRLSVVSRLHQGFHRVKSGFRSKQSPQVPTSRRATYRVAPVPSVTWS